MFYSSIKELDWEKSDVFQSISINHTDKPEPGCVDLERHKRITKTVIKWNNYYLQTKTEDYGQEIAVKSRRNRSEIEKKLRRKPGEIEKNSRSVFCNLPPPSPSNFPAGLWWIWRLENSVPRKSGKRNSTQHLLPSRFGQDAGDASCWQSQPPQHHPP